MIRASSPKQKQFKQECKVINLKYEYPGYKGDIQWIVITDLSEPELLYKYPDEIKQFVPFVCIPISQGEIFDEFNRNEDKFQKRNKNNGHIFDLVDGEFETHHKELAINDMEDKIVLNFELSKLKAAINRLNPIQKQRLLKYYFTGKTIRQIAKEEGVNISAVNKSILSALENLRKFLN